MITKIKITEARPKDFKPKDDPEKVVPWCWYKGEIVAKNGIEDIGSRIEFGSKDKSHVEGRTYEIELYKKPETGKIVELVED